MSTSSPPALPPPVLENIPMELRALPNWVAWRQELRESSGRQVLAKLPVNPRTGSLASSTNSSTWGSIEEAVARYECDGLAGVGFVFAPPYCGVDLDTCRNPETGIIEHWAIAHMEGLRHLHPAVSGR